MHILTSQDVREVATWPRVIHAVEKAFCAEAAGTGAAYPVVLGSGSEPGAVFGIKSGRVDHENTTLGLKVASYWAPNISRGMAAHSSNTLLLDDETGRPRAFIAGDYLNCLRTAAANAVASRLLARADASTLCLIGAGHQAYFEAIALSQVRPIEDILIVARSVERGWSLATRLSENINAACRAVTLEEGLANADIVTTVTPARAPLFDAGLIQPGIHISAMGADTRGKQELPPGLFSRANLFADKIDQSRQIGEFQHLPNSTPDPIAIGSVLNGDVPGRRDAEAITIFDSSGIALQDLLVAEAILQAALDQRLGIHVPL